MAYSFEQHKMVGAIGADDGYWRGLEDGVFQLQQCTRCKGWSWPAHYRCGQCGSWELQWVPIDPDGQIFTYTRTRYAFDRVIERKDQVPYITIVAELPQADGARVMGVLKGSEDGLRIGAAVRGSIDPPSALTKHYPALRWEIA